ncbi:hypothetical protein [Streptacidiphilus rugosus]|uniref:hypothetical protein n=1 Tax=Streptacidiphilus rugosus TaxID=405783 RepID=UPI000569F221|nr:hypothetical protein [Streptacidiphilus rugosus]
MLIYEGPATLEWEMNDSTSVGCPDLHVVVDCTDDVWTGIARPDPQVTASERAALLELAAMDPLFTLTFAPGVRALVEVAPGADSGELRLTLWQPGSPSEGTAPPVG